MAGISPQEPDLMSFQLDVGVFLANLDFPRNSQGDGKSTSSCFLSMLEVISCLFTSTTI